MDLHKANHSQHQLSAREIDCLSLLSRGLSTAQVCTELAISRSTLEKHLASIRRKFDVPSTLQALAQYCNAQREQSYRRTVATDQLLSGVSDNVKIENLADRLEDCFTLDDAFDAVANHASRIGYKHMIFGLVPDPFGRPSDSPHMIASSFPTELMELYQKAGGAKVDPVAMAISTQRNYLVIDQELLLKYHSERMPEIIQQLTGQLLDMGTSKLLVSPAYDHATDAPYCLSVDMDAQMEKEVRGSPDIAYGDMKAVTMLFWSVLRKKSLLAPRSGLSLRQRELLRLIARGFNSPEVAEHMGISIRAVERLLQNARSNLGVSSTPAAIYRSTVFGALSSMP